MMWHTRLNMNVTPIGDTGDSDTHTISFLILTQSRTIVSILEFLYLNDTAFSVVLYNYCDVKYNIKTFCWKAVKIPIFEDLILSQGSLLSYNNLIRSSTNRLRYPTSGLDIRHLESRVKILAGLVLTVLSRILIWKI